MAEALLAADTLPHRSDFTGWREIAGRNEHRLIIGALKVLATRLGMERGNKSITPAMERGSSEFYKGFLRGFFDADGSIQGNQRKGVSVRLSQSDLPRLQAVQRMLLRLGIVSVLYEERRSAGVSKLPDGRGGHADYPTKANHELIISGESLRQFRDLVGFADHEKASRLNVAIADYQRAINRERFVARVASIDADAIEDVYDVSIPGINAFDANGLLAHNCGEQPLPPHGACLLGSINLARLVDRPFAADADLDQARLEALTATAVRFLDDVIDVSNYPLPAQKKEAKAKRRIGLGVTGLADALILCGVRYGTPKAVALAESWMAAIERAAYLASADLAREKGPFPLYDAGALPGGAATCSGCPRRCAAPSPATACATGSSPRSRPPAPSRCWPATSPRGIEPVFDFQYDRRVLERDGRRAHRDGGGLRARPLSPAVRRHGAADAGLRHGRGARAPRAPGDAGRPAAPRRQLHLQDHQLPRRHQLRGFQGRLSRGLRPGPQGLHHLSGRTW